MVQSSGAAVPALRLSAVPRGHRWAALVVLCAAALIINVDNTILNVALPTLVRDLHATSSELQWIVDSYAMVFAGPAARRRQPGRPVRAQAVLPHRPGASSPQGRSAPRSRVRWTC